MERLQSCRKIVIDPAVCPKAAKEFAEYGYDRGRDGEVIEAAEAALEAQEGE